MNDPTSQLTGVLEENLPENGKSRNFLWFGKCLDPLSTLGNAMAIGVVNLLVSCGLSLARAARSRGTHNRLLAMPAKLDSTA